MSSRKRLQPGQGRFLCLFERIGSEDEELDQLYVFHTRAGVDV